MAKNFITDLSTTAASNVDIVGQDIQGSANVSGGDNAIRNLAQLLAKFYDDLGGITSAGGSATAVTITAVEGWTAYGTGAGEIANGTLLAMKMTATATGAATLAVNGLGTKKIRRQGDSAILVNDWLSGGIYIFRYDTAYDGATGAWVLLNPNVYTYETHGIAASDETTSLTTGTAKASFSLPYAFTVVGVYATLNTVSSSGTPTIDINEDGTTILSTKIVIDVSEYTGGSAGYQGTAAAAAVISDASIAAFAQITVDIDVAGTGAKGLKVFLVGYPS